MTRTPFSQWRSTLSTASKGEWAIFSFLVAMTILVLIGAIGLLPIDAAAKGALIALACILVIGVALNNLRKWVEYYTPPTTPHEHQEEHPPHQNLAIPPKPSTPPRLGVRVDGEEESSGRDEFEMPEEATEEQQRDNPSLYRHSFSIIPVILKFILTGLIWIGILIVAIFQGNWTMWWIFIIFTPCALAYCYFILLRWNGEEFVVNDEWYERPLTMPSPFQSKTPAIRRSEVGMYEIRQTFIDKIFDTCQLYSDTHVKGDEKFHNVKWLTHPAELRRATGISAPRKNSYMFLSRKHKKK